MEQLNLPSFEFNIKNENDNQLIWDDYRKKFVVLTPEEWVRQNFIRYLQENLLYPKGLIQVEGGMSYNKLSKRSDIVIYNPQGKACMIVECKSTDVKISQEVFEQVAVYNTIVKAKYVVITNGLQHFCCEVSEKTGKPIFMNEIPVCEWK